MLKERSLKSKKMQHVIVVLSIFMFICLFDSKLYAFDDHTQPVYSYEYAEYGSEEIDFAKAKEEIARDKACNADAIDVINTTKISTLYDGANAQIVGALFQVNYTLKFESPDYHKNIGQFFSTKYTDADSIAVLSDTTFYIHGYRVSYLLEDGGEYYMPSDAIDQFAGPEGWNLSDGRELINPKHDFYNLNYKTSAKAGSKIGGIKAINTHNTDGGTFEIAGIKYIRISDFFDNWRHDITYNKTENTLYYGTMPSKGEKKLNDDVIYNFIAKATVNCKTNTERVKAIHDAIVLGCAYDQELSYHNPNLITKYMMTDNQSMTLHMIIDKTGVCENYARFFKESCDRLLIPCELVQGYASDAHLWNRVYLDGKWLHIDGTFADYIGNKYKKNTDISRKYYLKSAFEFMGTHKWSGSDYKKPVFSEAWSKIDRNNIKTTEQLRNACLYASKLSTNGKQTTYKFKITGNGVLTSCGQYVVSNGYASSIRVGYSKGVVTVIFN